MVGRVFGSLIFAKYLGWKVSSIFLSSSLPSPFSFRLSKPKANVFQGFYFFIVQFSGFFVGKFAKDVTGVWQKLTVTALI